jgi:C-terminal lipocalin-like domain
MKKLLFVAIASMALFSACKKKDVEKTTAEKLIGRWALVSDTYNDYYGGSAHIINYTGTASDYVEFKADGTVTASYQGSSNTTSYSLQGDTKVVIAGETNEIRTLTDNGLVLYSKTLGVVAGEYEEETSTFKK